MSRAKDERREIRAQDKAELDRLLLEGMRRLRVIMANKLKARLGADPEARKPCHTCAFRSSTDVMQGFDTTAVLLLGALMGGKPFYCHEDPQTGEPFPLINGSYGVQEAMAVGDPVDTCAGWEAVKDSTPDDIARIFAEVILGRPLKFGETAIVDHLRENMSKFSDELAGGKTK